MSLPIYLIKFLSKIIPRQFKHPLAVWVYKRLLLSTSPVEVREYHNEIGVCSILSHNHVYFYLLSIKSFFYFSKLTLPVFVVGDGSLTPKDISLLKHHIHNIRILDGKEAEKRILQKLQRYPYCLQYRKEIHPKLWNHNKKLFDPILLSGFKKFIYLDADILFFNVPQEIVDWVRSQKRLSLHMSYTEEYVQHEDRWGFLTVKVLSKLWKSKVTVAFNSGIICSYRVFIRLPKLEKYLRRMYDFSLEHTWLGEQVAFSLLFSELEKTTKKGRVKQLNPHTYYVLTDLRVRRWAWNKICIHYHGDHKNVYLYYDGVKLLIRTGLFRS